MDPFKKKKPSHKSSALICHVCLCRKHHLLTHLVCIYPCLTWPPLAVWWHKWIPSICDDANAVSGAGVTAGSHWLCDDYLCYTTGFLLTCWWKKTGCFWPRKRKGHPSLPNVSVCFSPFFHHRQMTFFFLSWKSPLVRHRKNMQSEYQWENISSYIFNHTSLMFDPLWWSGLSVLWKVILLLKFIVTY